MKPWRHLWHIAAPPEKDREFGLLLALVLLCIGVWPLLTGGPWRVSALMAGMGVVLLAMARPHWLHGGHRGWLVLGSLLQYLFTPLVLAVLFFGVITPLALVRRRVEGDFFRLRFDARCPTYWQPRQPPGATDSTMRQQF